MESKSLEPIFFNPQHCIFCGENKPLTGEHIFAAWIARAINYSSKQTSWSLRLGDDYQSTLLDCDHAQSTLQILCNVCNNEWGSDIQDSSSKILKTLIAGNWKILTDSQRKQMAKWVTSFVMVREFVHPELLTMDVNTRKKFRDDYTIPEGTRIWISPFEGKNRNLTSWQRAFAWNLVAVPPKNRDTYFMLFSISKILVLVFGSSSPELKHWDDIHIWTMNKFIKSIGMVNVWPIESAFEKTKPPSLSDADFDKIIPDVCAVLENPLPLWGKIK